MQALGDVQGGRVAQIVRIGLERQAQQADGPAFQDVELFLKLLDHHLALRGVDVERGLQELAGVAVLARGVEQRLNVLAEATSAPADAGVEELGADARIETDAGHHFGASAPTRSQMLAISLAKPIFIARNALAAYLIISALVREVASSGTEIMDDGRGTPGGGVKTWATSGS